MTGNAFAYALIIFSQIDRCFRFNADLLPARAIVRTGGASRQVQCTEQHYRISEVRHFQLCWLLIL